ncbi:hypothetical protein AK812_SmicGene34835 [Symbiodinium microadriaticum]|uniref:Uncharacterized protein n=1 Tax=Symbiodinium microadriaticum TaxID=2951 RepID=A0A1Q9CMZ8_SYMMI|nr:hypothetical protein AK812_SmicGene34835 [Symbiodinium microadriaticum]CAE7627051.1 unnamed protein product [Symbiodinium microadriaticum]
MFRVGFFQGIIVALLAPIIAEKGTDLEDSLLEALGQEIDSEDCSLLNEGPSCQASAFLQTGAALRWSESLRTEKAEVPRISEPLSFLELQEETGTEAAVGEVHSSRTAEEVGELSQKVGEVHADRSQELLRQWQEDGVELYAAAQAAPSVGSLASEATDALKNGLAGGHQAKGITGFSLSIALLVVVSVASLVAALYWGPWLWKLDPQVPQWLPEALSQDLVAREAKAPELEEGPPPPEQASELPSEAKREAKLSEVPKLTTSAHAEAGLQERLRQLVLEAAVCQEENLEQVLPSAAGYDCALSKPVSSGCAVKLLCRIEGALPGGPPPLGLLRAPLSQRSCVLFRSVAEGAMPKKAEEAVDFQVSLVSAPWIRIDVLGHEVKLLETPFKDQEAFTPYQAFGDLPKHWKHFVSPVPEPKASFLPPIPAPPQPALEREVFRFREELLQVGAEVILCGELIRDSSGRIFLQPWQENFENSSWRTSWELEGCLDLRPAVLASTEAALMEVPGKVPTAESCFDEFAVMVP